MSALARYLLARGIAVSGSDRVWNEQLEGLQALGAEVHAGHDRTYVDGAGLVVVTSAVSAANGEIDEATSRGIPVVKRAQFLARIANAGRSIAVAGTHGKTTTSALVGHILIEAGLDPTVLVGGIVNGLESNARVGAGEWIVVEADEYDRSFLHLRPEIAILTNVEPDHLDIYGTEEAVLEAYREFAAGITGTLIACLDDPHMQEVTQGVTARVITYGSEGSGADTVVRDLHDDSGVLHFERVHDGRALPTSTRLAGRHNALNATAALLATEVADIPPDVASAALAGFAGVQRRFQVRGEADGVLVLDDYAHHPTEIRTVLSAARARFHRPIRVVFQPHTYSRMAAFFDHFVESFDEADAVYLMDIYAARESDTLGMSSRALADAAGAHGASVMYTGTEQSTLDAVSRETRPGDVLITMGAGDVTALGPLVLERLASR
jgi:UDP-N-acetylmuramate--alanine ligase